MLSDFTAQLQDIFHVFLALPYPFTNCFFYSFLVLSTRFWPLNVYTYSPQLCLLWGPEYSKV